MDKIEFEQEEKAQAWLGIIIVIGIVVSLFLVFPQKTKEAEKYWSKVEEKIPERSVDKVNEIWKILPDKAKEKILNISEKEDIVVPALYRSRNGELTPTIVSISWSNGMKMYSLTDEKLLCILTEEAINQNLPKQMELAEIENLKIKRTNENNCKIFIKATMTGSPKSILCHGLVNLKTKEVENFETELV